jgi:hypothetical protein
MSLKSEYMIFFSLLLAELLENNFNQDQCQPPKPHQGENGILNQVDSVFSSLNQDNAQK